MNWEMGNPHFGAETPLPSSDPEFQKGAEDDNEELTDDLDLDPEDEDDEDEDEEEYFDEDEDEEDQP